MIINNIFLITSYTIFSIHCKPYYTFIYKNTYPILWVIVLILEHYTHIIIRRKYFSKYFNSEELATWLDQHDFWTDFERAVIFNTPSEEGADSEEDIEDEYNIVDNLSGRQ